MTYWDTSAIVPLLVKEADTDLREGQLLEADSVVTWWGTRLECLSALARREREGAVKSEAIAMARRRLDLLAEQWMEVLPADIVRERAERLLRLHSLRAADALQLASALIAFEERPGGVPFFCGDRRLTEAAALEGFQV